MGNRAQWVQRITLSNVALAVMLLSAFSVGTLALKRLTAPDGIARSGSSGREPRRVANWDELVRRGRKLGSVEAPVRVVEFADFQCPSCARIHKALDSAATATPQRFAITYLHLPLTAIHPAALAAAVAAECAGRQERFAAYHALLYERQRELSLGPWRAIAAEVGVADLEAFERCVAQPDQVMTTIRAHGLAARRLRIVATPTLVVDTMLYPAGTPFEEILRRLRSRTDP